MLELENNMPSDKNNGFNDMVTEEDLILAAAKQARDRVRRVQEDPSSVSPLENSPQEQDYFKNLTGAVAGSIQPVGKMNLPLVAKLMGRAEPEIEQGAQRLFGDTAKTAGIRGVADVTADMAEGEMATAAERAKTQQALSRAVDMQQRDAKQSALRKLLGK